MSNVKPIGRLIEGIKYLVKTSPKFKTLIFVFSVVISGVLSGGFINEITTNGKVAWNTFYKSTCFYLLDIYCFLAFIYYRFVYNEEVRTENFMDEDYCKAYMRKEAIPELARKYKEELKKGSKPSELKEYHKELRELLK